MNVTSNKRDCQTLRLSFVLHVQAEHNIDTPIVQDDSSRVCSGVNYDWDPTGPRENIIENHIHFHVTDLMSS